MIIIPMAGRSRRFFQDGYCVPKYQLPLHGKTLFEWSLLSFKKYFGTDHFVFVALKKSDSEYFIRFVCQKFNIHSFEIFLLDEVTDGQAETVARYLVKTEDEGDELYIFNIDTIRLNFEKPSQKFLTETDGFLETFVGSGKNWSNIIPHPRLRDRVVETKEKEEASEYCCTGLYYWKSSIKFLEALEKQRSMYGCGQLTEFFIAPLYNNLIGRADVVKFTVIEEKDVIFAGTPEEYMHACSAETGAVLLGI